MLSFTSAHYQPRHRSFAKPES
ncbi:uncharacterized protein ARMOST_10322 [Armillaria ostoyae]|uniref:Uncharacterized protein n=1 Tax=Armillaria ostoyae TaxID=47428 RepID=A0A284RDZ0_ARMOS|nr:uncharacterized protein ARMOST_10322 [Armillaria ostoyae]